MSMPKPQQSESRTEFVKRFMATAAMMQEYPEGKQRYAVCLEQWEKGEMMALKYVILAEMAGAPGEFQLLPQGRIEIKDQSPAYLEEADARAVVAAFRSAGHDMVIDYEHQSLEASQAPAAGWIKDLLWKGEQGLWALVEWTKKAKEYLESREYRYFSPVMLVRDSDQHVVRLVSVALTNTPAMNHLAPLVAKEKILGTAIPATAKEVVMIEKLKKMLGLAADATEAKIEEALTLLVNKAKTLETQAASVIACKEVLEALGAKADAGKDEVVRIAASLKAPGDVAVQLSQEVARLSRELADMKQSDLVLLALKEGKTSPDELDKWGRDLALKNPEQFKLIVLSRPAGSVIPVERIVVAKDQPAGALDDTQKQVNRMLGIDDETFKKYNK